MAEGIGNSLGQPRFVFSSAGVTPQPLDARTVEFMAGKGIDISGQTSKSLEQVPDWEQYQVIVALGARGAQGRSRSARQDHLLHLGDQGPVEGRGPARRRSAAFESAYQSLESHIQELVGAILEEPQPESKP